MRTLTDTNLPQELRQFVADVARNARRYPLEFTPEELAPIKRVRSATARMDPLNGSWVAALDNIERNINKS